MNEFKRAMLSLTRRKGKTIILFAVIFIVGNLIAGAISISQATKKSEDQLKTSLGSVANINLDFEKLMNDGKMDGGKLPELDEKWIQKLGEREEVKSYDYNLNSFLTSKEYKRYVIEDKENNGMMGYASFGGEGANFSVKGVHDPNVLDITDGGADLTDGRVFTQDEVNNGSSVTLVSKQFAEENNLQVGDTFKLNQDIYEPLDQNAAVSMNDMPKPIATEDVVLEIIGIFDLKAKKQEQSSEKKNNDMGMSAFMDEEKLNTFYVPNGFVNGLFEKNIAKIEELIPGADTSNEGSKFFEPTFILKSPDMLDSFEAAVKAEMPEYYMLNSSKDEYNKVAGSINSLKSMSTITLIVAVAAGIVIIGLIMMLFLRERKHEMGIYLSIGAQKSKIIMQIMMEVLIVGMIAITLAIGTGNMLAKGISQTMIQNQQMQEAENGTTGAMSFGVGSMSEYGGDVSEEDAVESFNVSMTPMYVVVFYAIGLGTIIISTLIPIIYFMRLNPKEIML